MAYSNAVNQKNKNQDFNCRLLHSQEEERRRIANELHDGIGQNLLAFKYQKSVEICTFFIYNIESDRKRFSHKRLDSMGLK